TIDALAGFSPASIGSPEDYLMALTVDPNDTVHLGGMFMWLPSRQLGLIVEQQALAQTQLATFADVLSDLVACNQLSLSGFNGCNMACMQQLCSAALADRWQLALDASANHLMWAELPFEASGPSELNVEALLKAFQGEWLGEIIVNSLTTKVTGSIAAEAPAEPAG
ncbi:MAG TPA: hypothetical protein VFB62_00790, partial [Polyangiaceae bacterium]|nr:hypothetical protein [Polyangiaceae bacterium]